MSKTIQKDKTANPLLTNLQNPGASVKTGENTNAKTQTKQTETQAGNKNTNAAAQGLSGTTQANDKPKDQYSDFVSGALAIAGMIGLAWLLYKNEEKSNSSREIEGLKKTVSGLERELAAEKRENRKVNRRVVEIEDVEPIEEKSFRNGYNRRKGESQDDIPTAYLDI